MSEQLSQVDKEQNKQIAQIEKDMQSLLGSIQKLKKKDTNPFVAKAQAFALFAATFVMLILFFGVEVDGKYGGVNFKFNGKNVLIELVKFGTAAATSPLVKAAYDKYKE